MPSRTARLHQHVSGVTERRIGGDAGKRVAAAALHAEHQVRRRAGFSPPPVECFQSGLGFGNNAVNDGAKTPERLILHAYNASARFGALGEQPFGNQLLAAQSDHQHLAAEIRIARDVLQRADRDRRLRRVDRDTAAIGMRQHNDVIDERVLWQQLGLDPLEREFNRPRHALHAGADGQDVPRANRAVLVAIPLERVTGERFGGWSFACRQIEPVEAGRHRHADARLVHPLALGDWRARIPDHLAVADDRLIPRQINQGDLVPLRNMRR
jgi:hypothetical protein